MWSDLWAALALLLIFEGIMPFLSPSGFKKSLQSVLSLKDSQLRSMGLVCMIAGLLLLYWVR